MKTQGVTHAHNKSEKTPSIEHDTKHMPHASLSLPSIRFFRNLGFAYLVLHLQFRRSCMMNSQIMDVTIKKNTEKTARIVNKQLAIEGSFETTKQRNDEDPSELRFVVRFAFDDGDYVQS